MIKRNILYMIVSLIFFVALKIETHFFGLEFTTLSVLSIIIVKIMDFEIKDK